MSLERANTVLGWCAYALLGAVVLVMAVRLTWDGRPGAGLAILLPLVVTLWRNPRYAFTGDWRSELPPPSFGVRAVLVGLFWLGMGWVLAFPEVVGSAVVNGPSGGVQMIILAVSALPAAALLDVALRAGLPVERRAELSWGIERLGPLSAALYLVNRESLATGRRTMQ
jgi:hypothetical protein